MHKMTIGLEINHERPNIRPKCITFSGNYSNYLDLRDRITKSNFEMEDLVVSNEEFITSNLLKPLLISFIADPEVPGGLLDNNGHVEARGYVIEEPNRYIWYMSETEASVIANLFHGFDYAWDHLHFDPKTTMGDLSVYCVLES